MYEPTEEDQTTISEQNASPDLPEIVRIYKFLMNLRGQGLGSGIQDIIREKESNSQKLCYVARKERRDGASDKNCRVCK
ncbi:hypothetical protein T08_10843 [Trichinella sp. T8]|nr:hypothetical protein T08_10843 [Trichinella sp. T8]